MESEESFALHFRPGHGVGRPKFINVNISGVYEVIRMKLGNLIPKSHLEDRSTLLIAPKPGRWAKKSKRSNVNISGVYEVICTKFCSLMPPISSNP